MKFDELFRQADALPVIPRVMQELIASFNDDAVDIDSIAQHISVDQVLSAKLLQSANSSYYRTPKVVASVADAIALLGFVNLRTLVISIGLRGSFKPVPGIDPKQFWRYSVHTATASRYLAAPLGLDAELAFTVGLMRSIGHLVMRLGMPEQMREMDRSVSLFDPRRQSVERTVLGYSHLDVGAELVRRWNFPAVFSGTIVASADPLAQSSVSPLAAEIYIAAWRACAEARQLTAQDMEAAWPADVATSIALPKNLVVQDFPPWDLLCEGIQALL